MTQRDLWIEKAGILKKMLDDYMENMEKNRFDPHHIRFVAHNTDNHIGTWWADVDWFIHRLQELDGVFELTENWVDKKASIADYMKYFNDIYDYLISKGISPERMIR